MGKWHMKFGFAALTVLLFLSLALLSGCAGLDNSQAPEKTGEDVTVKTSVNIVEPDEIGGENASQVSAPNQTNGNAANITDAANATLNQTNESLEILEWEIDEPVPVSTRNVSDRIYDGDFGLKDLELEPLKVYVIDCGNADCILVNKGEFYMLVDAGSAEPVETLLAKLKVEKLTAVVATRDSPIAIGGMGKIIQDYPVGEFWYNGIDSVDQSLEYKTLLYDVRSRGIAIKRPSAGEKMNVSGLAVKILNPQKPLLHGNPDIDAIVMKLESNDACMLLLNPTVQEREPALANLNESLRCDVATYFKWGEGRQTRSLMMMSYAKPKDVIISVGKNEFGLPSKTTLTYLALDSVNVWRTDLDGTVGVFVDSAGYEIGKYNVATGNLTMRKE
ncbi:MAG: hypothetical protein NT051_05750 [Candidatus Micrarchaeota archaeon]|nr:hypothetical protein [Candidatus Micrarchaeota archaeon]